jgi:anti-anti-sigma factor
VAIPYHVQARSPRTDTSRAPARARDGRLRDAGTPRRFSRPLRVTTTSVGFRCVVSVAGEIDMATVATLREAVDAVLLSSERDIWIDLTQVGFIDSTGLHVLVHAHRMLDRDQRRLAVIAPDGPVLRTLGFAGLDAFLRIFPDRSSAHRLS